MHTPRKCLVIVWKDAPPDPQWDYEVTCEHCEADLLIPSKTGTRIIATKGMSIIYDNTPQPFAATPEEVQCPVCRSVYSNAIEEVAK